MDHFKTVSSSPHIRSNVTTASIMRDVCIALLPALVCSVIYFGVRAAFITALSVIFCVGFEFLWQKITKKDTALKILYSFIFMDTASELEIYEGRCTVPGTVNAKDHYSEYSD